MKTILEYLTQIDHATFHNEVIEVGNDTFPNYYHYPDGVKLYLDMIGDVVMCTIIDPSKFDFEEEFVAYDYDEVAHLDLDI
jgi:hypothetical protein